MTSLKAKLALAVTAIAATPAGLALNAYVQARYVGRS